MSVWTTSPLVVGHRGGRPAAGEVGSASPELGPWPPENTLPAFERAWREGARAVELDARTCAGGAAVVFHDPTLARMTGSRDVRPVHDVPLAALQALDLGGGARVPTLAEVLRWAADVGVAVNVEMKHDVPSRVRSVRSILRVLRRVPADVLLSSFDPVLLALAGALAPRVPRALLTHRDQPAWADVVQAAARPPWVQALHLEKTQVGSDTVARCLRRGVRVGVWTVNDLDEARRLVDQGAATIITDRAGDVIAGLSSSRSPSPNGPGIC